MIIDDQVFRNSFEANEIQKWDSAGRSWKEANLKKKILDHEM